MNKVYKKINQIKSKIKNKSRKNPKKKKSQNQI